MDSNKILITGGLGFIGTNTVNRLLQLGKSNEIVIIDDKEQLSNANRNIISHSRVKYLKGSILDNIFLQSIESDFDYIIHAAAVLGIEKVAVESLRTLDVNIIGTRNCLEIARKQKGLKRFVLFSSSEIYGPNAVDQDENKPAIIPSVGKRWCYAASKLAVEQYTKAYKHEYGVPFTIIRPFNVYGPYRNESNAISTFILNALDNQSIQISGNGTQKRSWCYVDDFVDGLLQAIISEDLKDETLNLGNPENHISIIDLARLIVNITNSSSHVEIIGGANFEDVDFRQPNIFKAKKLFNYSPATSLNMGLHKTIEWYITKDEQVNLHT